MSRTVKVILFIFIMLLGVSAVAVYWTFFRTLPDYRATVEIQQLNESVQIKWDTYGVPHIYASNKKDLYMGVGYVHAQDRLWHMTVSQMAAQGRFAEFLGKDLVPFDKFQRTIGFWRIAQKIESQLPDSTRQILHAYANGVNRYTELHQKELPIQFSLADMDPIPWTPTHSLALARLMAWELNIAWKTELTYNMLFEKLSTRQFKELFSNPKVTSNLPEAILNDTTNISAVLLPLLKNQNKYAGLMQTKGSHTGSNAWAVDGSKSNSSKPLLAGDPHLGLSIPGKWYEVHLNLSGKNLSGATLPGAPSVVLGQSDVLAWSFTNVMLDDTDFFKERLHPQDSSRYLLGSLAGEPIYEDFITQREVIKVKDEDDQLFIRKLTKHGPVISDIYPQQKMTKGNVISMRWTGQDATSELEALQTMGWAKSFEAFQAGIKKFKNPAQNIIYADTAGNIALFTAANIPLRSGNPIVLRNGWQPELDWQGYVAEQEMPAIVNPERGWVANANNPVAKDDYPYYISVYWQPDSRYNRIEQYLNGNQKFSPEAFQVMQNDTYSSFAQSVATLVIPALESSSDSSFAEVTNYLNNWDYTYEESETAASLMDIFLLRLARNTLRDEIGADLYTNFISYSAKPARIMLRLLQNDSSLFDDRTTNTIETKEQIIQKSMKQTLAFLDETFGSEPAEWRWENLHTLTLRPALFGRAANDSSASQALKLIVNNILSEGPYPAPGNSMSINNGEYLWTEPFDMVLGPSIRRIVDLSNTSRSLSVIPGGQSGNPLSDYYNDQTQSWLNGQYKFLSQDSTLQQQHQTTRLVPPK